MLAAAGAAVEEARRGLDAATEARMEAVVKRGEAAAEDARRSAARGALERALRAAGEAADPAQDLEAQLADSNKGKALRSVSQRALPLPCTSHYPLPSPTTRLPLRAS